MAEKPINIHKDHRRRMRKKLQEAPQALSDHEIVEMLLYNSIPRGNTNSQAHELLRMGGNLRGILNLEMTQICSVDGLGENTDSFIRLMREFYIRVERDKLDKKNSRKITRKNISQKLHKLFFGQQEERMVMITVDKNCCLLNVHTIATGSASAAVIPIKRAVKTALEDNASYVFLAHNHPNNILAPSEADIETTRAICEALALVDVPVIEHYIVTEAAELGIISHCR